jgi:c-di-GMP-binding flagellar brake protein YcgR
MTNKRKHPRVNIRVLASFDCYNEDGEVFKQKLGVILDISLGGMLIETDDIIRANYVEIIFVNHEHELMSIVGSIVHSKKFENGKVKTGVCFHGADSENVKIATNLIRAHYFGNKKSSLQQAKSTDIQTRSTS